MSSLSMAALPVHTVRQEIVKVPEFGRGENGDPHTVNVRAQTVMTANILSSKVLTLSFDDNGDLQKKLNEQFDRASIVAAMHAYDDDGELVFGKSVDEAIRYVSNLPERYRPAIYRISHEAIRLSDLEGDTEAKVIEAEKKS